MITPTRPADPTKKMIRLIDQRLKERTCIRFDQRKQRAQTSSRGKPMLQPKSIDDFLTTGAAIAEFSGECIDGIALTQNAPAITG